MHHRDGIRPRPIDDHRSLLIIKDLTQAKLNSNKEEQAKLNNIEKELYKVLEHYDKRKKGEIPKSKINNEKNDKNEKNEKIVSCNINNNIVYLKDNNDHVNQNNNDYILNYKLKEFKRPENYIIYSSKKKNEINLNKKIYEAKEADGIFLNIRDNFMSLEELENIIIDLENNAINDKEEKINEEHAREIIETKYSKYNNYIDSIINHFKDRRNSAKKSLIRKKWHLSKSSDKYLSTTFRRRERDKIKTRKNNQNKDESLNKIIDSGKICKNFILPIINEFETKEINNKLLIQIEELSFLSECDKIKKEEIPPNRIKENNIIKENIEKNLKLLKEKELINKKNESGENNPNKEYKINNKRINSINGNNIQNNKNNDINVINNNSPNTNEEETNSGKQTTNETKNNSNEYTNSIGGSNLNKKGIERKQVYPKNNLKNKNIELFPTISLDNLKNENYKEKDNNYIQNINNNLRVRIRLNRINKVVIDRYIQNNNDFNPFNDSYNDIINDYKKYDNSAYNYLNHNNFENLINSYNFNKTKNLNILYDSEDDSVDSLNDIKQFSNTYKQFLKSKRSHP